MFRIVRTSTHSALLADREALGQARVEAETATDSAIRAEDTAEGLAAQLRRVKQDADTEFEGMRAVLKQATAERDEARKERDAAREEAGALSAESGVLADVRQDLTRLRDHAADPVNGNAVRGAIAYGVLRDLITRARQERAEAGEDTRLPRPFDLVALVLGLDGDQDDADATAPVREDTAADCMNGTCSCHDRDKEADPGTRVCAACSARRPYADFDHGPICRNCPRMSASYHAARNA
ncbi:hypothetical protein [Streptomyces sp. NPDC090112]|uniref:hypothetical protein n=1 Tax=Streptomyces sp. NPDC090112 TaxID=3365949 RepID=UPI00383008CC